MFVGEIDDDKIVAGRRCVHKGPTVGVVKVHRAVAVQVFGGVAVGEVFGAQFHGLAVDVDVVDVGGAGGDGELADDAFGGADHTNAVGARSQEPRGDEEGLVVDELAGFGALPVVVAEQGDALGGFGDHHVLVGGSGVDQDAGEFPYPG